MRAMAAVPLVATKVDAVWDGLPPRQVLADAAHRLGCHAEIGREHRLRHPKSDGGVDAEELEVALLGGSEGPEDVKRIVTVLRAMLPDFRIEVEAMVAEGEFVVSRYTATATDTVGFMGMPATGKVIRTPAIQIFRFANGKIVESWAARDDLGTLKQLGHWPAAGR
jgi:steroid delta-isomerase-like uncharacterized protein